MQGRVVFCAVLWLCVSARVGAHGGEDHPHPAATPAAVMLPADRVSAQSGLVEAVLVGSTGASALDLYLSAQQSNAPLLDAEIEVTGLALAAPVKTVSAGHYRLQLREPLQHDQQLLALTVSATIGAETVLELLDITLTPAPVAPAAPAHNHALFVGFSWTSGFVGFATGLLLAMLLVRRPHRRPAAGGI